SLAGPCSGLVMARDRSGAVVVLEALPPFTRGKTVGRLTRFHHSAGTERTRFSSPVPNSTRPRRSHAGDGVWQSGHGSGRGAPRARAPGRTAAGTQRTVAADGRHVHG